MLGWKVFGSGLPGLTVVSICQDTATSVSAAGTTQGTATELTSADSEITTVAAGADTKTLVNPTSGTLDKVYGSDYVSASSHTTSVTVSGVTANAVWYTNSGGTAAEQSANLTFDGTNLDVEGAIQVGSGAVSGPALNFEVSATTGFYLVADGLIGVALKGVAGFVFDGNLTGSDGLAIKSDYYLGWSVGNPATQATDVGLSRLTAGVLGVGTGASASFAGRLKLTSAIAAGVAIASLNTSPTTGEVQSVTDALAPTLGTTVASGGSAKALVWYNGANWTVIGV